jgi:hypothetical protein
MMLRPQPLKMFLQGMVSHFPHLQKESMFLGGLIYMKLNLVEHIFQQDRVLHM